MERLIQRHRDAFALQIRSKLSQALLQESALHRKRQRMGLTAIHGGKYAIILAAVVEGKQSGTGNLRITGDFTENLCAYVCTRMAGFVRLRSICQRRAYARHESGRKVRRCRLYKFTKIFIKFDPFSAVVLDCHDGSKHWCSHVHASSQ